MIEYSTPPNDVRGFVHKRLFKAAQGFITGGPTGAISGFVQGKKQRPRKLGPFVPRVHIAMPRRRFGPLSRAVGRNVVAAEKFSPAMALSHAAHGHHPLSPGHAGMTAALLAAGKAAIAPGAADQSAVNIQMLSDQGVTALGDPGTCRWPRRWSEIEGRCALFLGDDLGPNGNGSAPGGPPTGRPHTVMAPVVTSRSTRRCQAGFVLGRDNMCYWHLPRNSKWRKWRPGRKPLFTGGDLNAIKRAGELSDSAEDIFRKTNPAKKAVARSYRANWRKPLKK